MDPYGRIRFYFWIPNINKQLKNYIKNKKNIELIEDYRLDRLRIEHK